MGRARACVCESFFSCACLAAPGEGHVEAVEPALEVEGPLPRRRSEQQHVRRACGARAREGLPSALRKCRQPDIVVRVERCGGGGGWEFDGEGCRVLHLSHRMSHPLHPPCDQPAVAHAANHSGRALRERLGERPGLSRVGEPDEERGARSAQLRTQLHSQRRSIGRRRVEAAHAHRAMADGEPAAANRNEKKRRSCTVQ